MIPFNVDLCKLPVKVGECNESVNRFLILNQGNVSDFRIVDVRVIKTTSKLLKTV